MKHNNVLSSPHLRKHWQKRVKTWYNQPARAERRNKNRKVRTAKLAPRPIDSLRPVVHCCTKRYNSKYRLGRGFSFQELEEAGLDPKYAPTIGISVDKRRENKSLEMLELNANRLKTYLSKLVVFGKGNKLSPEKTENAVKSLKESLVPDLTTLKEFQQEPPREVTEEENKFSPGEEIKRLLEEQKALNKKTKNRFYPDEPHKTGKGSKR